MRHLNEQIRIHGPVKGTGKHVEEWCELLLGGVLKYTDKLDDVYVRAKSGQYSFGAYVQDVVEFGEMATSTVLDSIELCDVGLHKTADVPTLVFVPPKGSETSTSQIVNASPGSFSKSLVNVDIKDFSKHLWVERTPAGLMVCIVDVQAMEKGTQGHYIGAIWDDTVRGAEFPIVAVHVHVMNQ